MILIVLALLLVGCAPALKDYPQANWKLVHENDEFYSWTCYIDQNKSVALKHEPPFDQSNMFDAVCYRYLKEPK